MRALAGAFSGVLFGIGLALGGMTRPAKVLGFLDFGGDWDPSLAFVMAGAIAAYAPLYRFILREARPLYVQQFAVFVGNQLDAPLILGSALFGVGWGLAGLCPGPGLVATGTFATNALWFAASMILGMIAFEFYDRGLPSSRTATDDAPVAG